MRISLQIELGLGNCFLVYARTGDTSYMTCVMDLSRSVDITQVIVYLETSMGV